MYQTHKNFLFVEGYFSEAELAIESSFASNTLFLLWIMIYKSLGYFFNPTTITARWAWVLIHKNS